VRDPASGEVSDWPVYERDALAPGVALRGPCIVAEDETSTLVGPGWTCRVDGLGYLDCARSEA
jgi:N-methylhydantoinase A